MEGKHLIFYCCPNVKKSFKTQAHASQLTVFEKDVYNGDVPLAGGPVQCSVAGQVGCIDPTTCRQNQSICSGIF